MAETSPSPGGAERRDPCSHTDLRKSTGRPPRRGKSPAAAPDRPTPADSPRRAGTPRGREGDHVRVPVGQPVVRLQPLDDLAVLERPEPADELDPVGQRLAGLLLEVADHVRLRLLDLVAHARASGKCGPRAW